MQNVLLDLRFAFRQLRKSPGFTLTAILTLTLGIGANTAVFSVVDAVLLRDLPYRDPKQLFMVWSSAPAQGLPQFSSSGPDYRAWRSENHSFENLGAYSGSSANLSVAGQMPETLVAAKLTASMLSILGARPLLGQSFSERHEQWSEHRVVLLSYGLWQRKFGADPTIVGRQVNLNGGAFTILGVMPQDFRLLDQPKAQLWTPLSWAPDDNMNTRNNHYLFVVGRLKPGLTESAAQADLDVIARSLERRFRENAGMGIRLQKLRDHLVGDVRPALLALFGAVLFVLLVACVNLANLMLSRAASRQKEFGIRCAMGANRPRLIRQFLIDSALLAVLGAGAGILVGSGILRAITTMLPTTFPTVGSISMDPRVLGFTAVLAVGSLLFFGLVPAFEASDAAPEQTLHDNQRGATQSRGSRRLKNSLVVTEIALATALLAGAGLFLKSFSQLQHQDFGFDPRNVLTFVEPLVGAQYDQEDKSLAFLQESIRRIQLLPGVRSVGIGTSLPLGFGMGWGKFVSGEGLPVPATTGDLPTCGFNLISPDYFKALGARIEEGRAFDDSDTGKSRPVAIVNQAFVKRFYPKGDALGKTIRLAPPDALRAQLPPPPAGVPQAPDRVVVGIVADLKNGNADHAADPEAFAPITQYAGEGWGPGNFVVRTDRDPMAFVPSVQKLIASMDPQQPISDVDAMTSLLGRSIAQSRFNAVLLVMFAGLAVMLAAVGIYGVISYGVSNRTHEIGVRMALGADRTSVLRMVLRESFGLTAMGLIAGLGLALALSRLVRTLLFGVGVTDPAVYILTALALGAVAMVATLVPARRAAAIEPMQALRAE